MDTPKKPFSVGEGKEANERGNVPHSNEVSMIVQIQNDLPVQVVCEGVHFSETSGLSFKDLSLFVERDLFTLAKSVGGEFSVTLVSESGSYQFRIDGKLTTAKKREAVRKRIESILWSYNRQKLIAKGGELYPQESRFTYSIELASETEVAHA